MSKISYFFPLLLFLFGIVNSSSTISVQDIKFGYDDKVPLKKDNIGYVIYGVLLEKNAVTFTVDSPVYIDEISYYYSNVKFHSVDEIPFDYFKKVIPKVKDLTTIYRFDFDVYDYTDDFIGLYVYFKTRSGKDNDYITIHSNARNSSKGGISDEWMYILIIIGAIVVVWLASVCLAMICGKSFTEGCCIFMICLACLCSRR